MSVGDIPKPDDPVDYYIETLRLDGKSERTIEKVEQSASYFKDYIAKEENNIEDFSDITPRDVKKIKNLIENKSDRGEASIKESLGRINRMYQYYSDRGTYEANPVKIAMNDITWDISKNPSQRSISVSEMKSKINEIQNPLLLAIIVLFAKTGIRAGELCNLDLQDVHLNHPLAEELLPAPRDEISDRPDTIFVPADISAGDEYNGEIREESNKRKRATKIPVDDELKQVLVYWLICRNQGLSTNALFVRITGSCLHERLDTDAVKKIIVKWAKSVGWHEKGGNNNVSPHYFRHFFTTKMRQRLSNSDIDGNDPKLFVKGIRGDKGSDVISVYTHQWGNYVRETYNKTMYSLL